MLSLFYNKWLYKDISPFQLISASLMSCCLDRSYNWLFCHIPWVWQRILDKFPVFCDWCQKVVNLLGLFWIKNYVYSASLLRKFRFEYFLPFNFWNDLVIISVNLIEKVFYYWERWRISFIRFFTAFKD